MREGPPAPLNETGAGLPSAQRALTEAPSRKTLRTVARVAVVLLFAASGVNAFYEGLNEARDIVTHAPEPLPGVMLFQFAVGLLAAASAIGVWRRASWSHRAIVAWGIVGAVFVALLEFLLKLGADARAGLLSGAAAVLVVSAALAWFARRDRRAHLPDTRSAG